MTDGVVLRAIILRPADDRRHPVLVYRTPYGAAAAVATYPTFRRAVDRGYAVVAQDVRGRYRSGGEFDPYRQEGRDGYDTIEWAAAQPWSDGNVGTFGLSYPGAVQWLAAVESPPHLKAMVPAMTFSRPTNFWYAGGLPDLSWPSWIWLNIGPDVRQRNENLPGPRTAAEAAASWVSLGERLVRRLPLTDVPELAEIAPWYLEWLSHPPNDPWWGWADLTTRYHRVSAAVLNLSGWHDDNYGPEGALTNHLGLLAARQDQPDPRTQLILGPWVHGTSGMNDRTRQAKSGERVFGALAGIDYDEEILRFMDHYLRGIDNGVDRAPRVRAFIMGENLWRTATVLPFPGTHPLRLNFSAGPAGGRLSEATPLAGTRTFVSDPDRPFVDPFASRSGAHDYRALATRSDVAVFETAALPSSLRVLGNIEVRLSISVDAPDADIWVRLFDVAPDGTAWNLMSPGLDVIRLSTRVDAPPLVPGQPTPVVLRDLLTGNQFKAGHRLRAVVMTSFMPYLARNLQTGQSEVNSADRRVARVTVHTGPGHDSFLVLPVIP